MLLTNFLIVQASTALFFIDSLFAINTICILNKCRHLCWYCESFTYIIIFVMFVFLLASFMFYSSAFVSPKHTCRIIVNHDTWAEWAWRFSVDLACARTGSVRTWNRSRWDRSTCICSKLGNGTSRRIFLGSRWSDRTPAICATWTAARICNPVGSASACSRTCNPIHAYNILEHWIKSSLFQLPK